MSFEKDLAPKGVNEVMSPYGKKRQTEKPSKKELIESYYCMDEPTDKYAAARTLDKEAIK